MKNKLLLLMCALSTYAFSQAPFGPKQTINSATGNFPKVIESGNLDNDQYADIVIGTNLGGTIEWYKNNGNGTFTLQTLVSSTLASVNGLTIADLDGDTDNDIIATSGSLNKLVWFENYGNGSFGPEITIATGLVGAGTVKAGDIDKDDDIDLAVVAYSSDLAVWFPNNGSGTFSAGQTISNISNSGPRDIDLGDYDMDGDLDVVIGYGKLYSVKLFNNDYIQTSNPTFTVEANNVVSYNYYINNVSFGDVDNNGDLEIIKVDILTNTAYYDKQSNGTFTETVFSTSNTYPAKALVSDFDDNGSNDVTIGYSSSASTDEITWYEDCNPGVEVIIDSSQNDIYSFTINDFDNDGDLDMASISSSENHLNWFRNTTYNSALDVTEFDQLNIKMYPNPTSDVLNISTSTNENLEVSIFNILGKKIMDAKLSSTNNTINVSQLNRGVYLVAFKGYDHTLKFVKQ